MTSKLRVFSVKVENYDAATRMYVFPHAGGNPGAYRLWQEKLGTSVEVVSFSFPGRGARSEEQEFTDWGDLVDAVVEAVLAEQDGLPFAFFGHSFGALLAFEVARALRDRQRPLPFFLFLSAHRPAHMPSANNAPEKQTHALPHDAFLDVVRYWEFIPEEALADEELLRLILPPLRSDLRLDELHAYRAGDPLPVPCVVYGGEADHSVSLDDLGEWRSLIAPASRFEIETFPGGHFYTLDHEDRLLASLSRHIASEMEAKGPSMLFEGPAVAPPEITAWEMFRKQVGRSPEALALEDGERRWSFGALYDIATLLARRLRGEGVTKRSVVGILLPHCAEYAISLLAIQSVGAVACLLEKNWSTALLDEFLASSETQIVITLPELVERLPAGTRERHCLALAEDWQEELRRTSETLPPQVQVGMAPHDIALISMTSGSTGKPKAVLTTHAGCTYCFKRRAELYPYRDGEREAVNVFFAWEFMRPLLYGFPAVVIPDDVIFDPLRLIKLIADKKITRLVVTTSLLESVLDYPGIGPTLADRLSHMEAWFLMGEVVPARVVEKAARSFPPHVQLINAYSTWESLDVAYAALLPIAAGARRSVFAPVGRLLRGSAGVLLDESGSPVPRGMAGELYVAGPGVAPGYLKDAAKTTERFVPLPEALAALGLNTATAYRTGDQGRILPDGQLEILGRIDSTVKIRGFKVSLHAVERALEGVEGVTRVVVVPMKDDQTAQPAALAAYVVGDAGAPSEAALARVRLRARERLPEYAVPRHYIGMDGLPLRQGESRKLDINSLPAPRETDAKSIGAPRELSGIEERIAQAWREVLGVADVQADDNFFALGGNSLMAAKLAGILADRFGIVLPVVDVFQYATLTAMAERCGAAFSEAPRRRRARPGTQSSKLAIIGMAGRFPGAASLDQFWLNLVNGHDSLRRFSREELSARGVPDHVLGHPNWVAAGQVLDDADKFDARFWGIGQQEAEIMDPQHRLFIETAWAAMEQAGYARRNNEYRHRTGVFAACGIDGYLIHHLQGGGLKDWLDPGRLFLTELGNEKDYIATRVAYLMDLGGPAVTVTSACSSALVAVAQAAQAVLSGQCDMAIGGGAAINFPNFGYCYEEGLVGSADGHVRPFDESASGTLFGDSVGAVVLKRLDDALADGDPVWAVLSGVGLSNDGHMKAGYAAPSAQAQTRCIVDAMTMAAVHAEQISYVECHATATHVGDAIELKGLYDAFVEMRGGTRFKPGSCSIGSVKGHIGHANCAAGITGLIKTVLALHHRKLPPTVNFERPNAKLIEWLDADDTPFTIPLGARDWSVTDEVAQLPRRAGVSSFGIGGTNAHIVLEEAPSPAKPPQSGFVRPQHILTVSAKTEGALARNIELLADALAEQDAAGLASAAFTLHTAREAHTLRASVVVNRDPAKAALALRKLSGTKPRKLAQGHRATVAFCFSGQGSQYAGMARGLYDKSADGGRFRAHFDAVCDALAPHLGLNPAATILEGGEAEMRRPIVTQCGLFAVEHALASTLVDFGIRPVAVAGHSIGEYAAAVLAGVLSLDDAAKLVAARASATEALTFGTGPSVGSNAGGMLSVAGDEEHLRFWLADRPGLWLAVENVPGQCVIAGLANTLATAHSELEALGFRCAPVPVSHPFHSALMAPVAAHLDDVAQSVSMQRPTIPMTSNLTGAWLGEDATRADYWGRHLLGTVRWKDNVMALLRWRPDVILEVGPSSVLCGLIAKCLAVADVGAETPLVLASMRRPKEKIGDAAALAETLGRLWCSGVPIDWAAYHDGETAGANVPLSRLRLPTYSFEPDSYWVAPEKSIYAALPAAPVSTETVPPKSPWLVRHASRPHPRMRLYCLPFAGGNSRHFEEWARTAPEWLDVVAVELPGRNGRAEEPVSSDDKSDAASLSALAAAIRADTGPLPFALSGLSFGSALAMELLTGPLADLDRNGQAIGLAVVGRAPILGQPPAAVQDPETFLMVPPELRNTKVWREIFLPALLADLEYDARIAGRLDAAWRANGGVPPLRCPVQVHCGLDDPTFAWSDARKWADASRGGLAAAFQYPGGHDFMQRESRLIAERVAAFIAPVDAGTASASAKSDILHAVSWMPLKQPARAGTMPVMRWRFGQESEAEAALADVLGAPEAVAGLVCILDPFAGDAEQCAGFVRIMQGLIERGAMGRLVLLLPASSLSGPVAGASRVVPLEHAGLSVARVFHDHGSPDSAQGSHLAAAALTYPREIDLLWRGGHLFAQRLRPCAFPGMPRGVLGSAGGRYLVTGATGGLGRALVQWLIDEQDVAPENLVLVARSSNTPHPEGTTLVAVDLADWGEAERRLKGFGPFEGIFHLAGVLDDGAIQNLDEMRVAKVLAAKLAVNVLLRLGRRWRTRWVVAFSSTSALLGAAGQSNYAAANAYFDHLAMWPSNRLDPPLTSIAWGTWGEVGMAARNGKARERAESDGETPLSTNEALGALASALSPVLEGSAQGWHFVAVRVDWGHSPWRQLPLVHGLPVAGPIGTPAPTREAEKPAAATAVSDGDTPVRRFLRRHIRHWEEDAELPALGFDSLDFAQLRSGFSKEFGVQVPLSAFAAPRLTLGQLAERLSAAISQPSQFGAKS